MGCGRGRHGGWGFGTLELRYGSEHLCNVGCIRLPLFHFFFIRNALKNRFPKCTLEEFYVTPLLEGFHFLIYLEHGKLNCQNGFLYYKTSQRLYHTKVLSGASKGGYEIHHDQPVLPGCRILSTLTCSSMSYQLNIIIKCLPVFWWLCLESITQSHDWTL